MMRTDVGVEDAVSAVLLLESSTESSSSLIRGHNILHSGFPADPLSEYKSQARLILTGLGLNDIWQQELERIEQLQSNFTPKCSCTFPRTAFIFPALLSHFLRNAVTDSSFTFGSTCNIFKLSTCHATVCCFPFTILFAMHPS